MSSLTVSLKKTLTSLGGNKLIKNDMFTNIALVIFIILTINYLNTKQYQATIFLYIVAAGGFYLCKSLSYGLIISIVLTNLLISMNYFKLSENFKDGKEKKKNKDKKNDKDDEKNDKNMDKAINKIKSLVSSK